MRWPTVALAEVASIERDGVAPEAIASGTRYLGLEHIESGGQIIGGDPVEAGDLASTKFAFSPRHVLFGKLRPYLAKIALPDFGGVCSTDILPVLPGCKLHRNYLAHFLRQPEVVALASQRATGANLPRLSPKALASFDIPLPPLKEQRRIAAILDQADALRRLRARALTRLDALGEAIFREMFGDPRTNPMGWPIKNLADLGILDRGVSRHRPRNDPALLGGMHPLIQTGDVSRANDYITSFGATYSDLGLKQSKMWRRGTLCITIAANIADTAILDFDSCFPDSVVGFDTGDEAMNFFVHRWFGETKADLERIAPAVAQKNINLAILRDLPVISPDPALIASFFARERSLRELRKGQEAELASLEKLFASLQHRAFRGEL